MQKSILYKMTQLVKIPIVLSWFFTITFRWNDRFHTCFYRKTYDFIGIITPVCQQCSCRYSFNQMHSFFAICSGTFCNKYSDRHTSRIHGKVNLGVEPPFVRLIS